MGNRNADGGDRYRDYPAVVRVELVGNKIRSEADFHGQVAVLLDFGPDYGHNLDALWDRLSTDVPWPMHLVWVAAGGSRAEIGRGMFGRIVEVLRAAAEQDAAGG